MATKRIRIKDIAARAGVSKSTVSLALRDDPRISSQRRREIKKIAERLGYYPDPALSALAASRSLGSKPTYKSTIVVACPSNRAGKLSLGVFDRQLLSGVRERAEFLGYQVELCATPSTEKRQLSWQRTLLNRGIRGLLLMLPSSSFYLDWDHFATVSLFVLAPDKMIHHGVHTNHFRGMMVMMDRLNRLGYRRPGLVLNDYFSEMTGQAWDAAYRESVVQHRFEDSVTRLNFSGRLTYALLRDWLNAYQPDVVIAKQSGYLKNWIEKAGFQVPEDVGYCDLDVGADKSTTSGNDQLRPAIGRVGVDVLDRLLKTYQYGLAETPHTIQVECRWINGDTLRKKKVRS